MPEIRSLGLQSIEIADMAADGDVGTVFATLGVTYQDTAELAQEDPEVTEFYSEENDDAEEVIVAKGKITVKWAIIDFQPATLVKVLGGTVTGTAPNDSWSAPAAGVKIEKSIKITPKSGKVITIPRANIAAKLSYKLSKKGIAMVEITARVLQPTKTGVKSIKIG
jgi:hypothetical protein